MKKLIAAAGIGAALATGALAVAPGASASPYGFLNRMHVEGFWSTAGDAGMLQNGYWICNQLDAGWTPAAATAALSAGNYYYDGSAGKFAAIATIELCPWHAGQGFYENVVA